MMINLRETADFLLNNDNFLLLCHSSPDGDTVGSATALARALQAKGKSVQIKCQDKFTCDFDILLDGYKDDDSDPEHIIAIDVADAKLLGSDFVLAYGDKVELCIDHHSTNVMYAEKTYLEPDSASTAEIIVELLDEMGVEITPVIATCLFTGVSTDTGCFRFSNTTVRTFEMAARLVNAGADSYNIITIFFETKTKSYAALERLALDTMRFFCNDKCAVIYVTQDMYRASGSDETETGKLAGLPRMIEGVLVGAFMRELKDGNYKISLRTHGDIDASAIAGRLGGGGHTGAAACTVQGPRHNALNLLVKEVNSEIEAFEAENK